MKEMKHTYEGVLRQKHLLSTQFRRYITWKTSNGEIRDYLGAEVGFIREWISSMFTEDMNWDNYGSFWVVDHIVPFRMFDLFNEQDLKICWNYRNLMPIIASDNLKKQGNSFFAFELLYSKRDSDLIYAQLFNKIKSEVEWMVKYIENYNRSSILSCKIKKPPIKRLF